MNAQEVPAMSLAEEVLEDSIVHDVVACVPPVRRIVVDGLDVEPEAAEEGD